MAVTDVAVGDVTVTDVAVTDVAVGDMAVIDAAVGDVAVTDVAVGDVAVTDVAVGDVAVGERWTRRLTVLYVRLYKNNKDESMLYCSKEILGVPNVYF